MTDTTASSPGDGSNSGKDAQWNDLARRFVNLWQQQAALALNDPAGTDALKTLLTAWGSATGLMPGQKGTTPHEPTGTAPAGAAPTGGGLDIAGLAQRLAECEARIARLESELGQRRRRTRRKAEDSAS